MIVGGGVLCMQAEKEKRNGKTNNVGSYGYHSQTTMMGKESSLAVKRK